MQIENVSPLRLPTSIDIADLFSEAECSSRLVYTLPENLIYYLSPNTGVVGLLDKACQLRELDFCKLSHPQSWVAFREQAPDSHLTGVKYSRLQELHEAVPPLHLGELRSQLSAAIRNSGQDPADQLGEFDAKSTEKSSQEIYDVLSMNHRYCQGYCGWLLQQREYWTDLDHLMERFNDSLINQLLPHQVFTRPTGAELIDNEDEKAAVSGFKAFCIKWRLQGLATLDLPIVVEPQYTATTIYTPNSPANSVSPHIPDIFPMEANGPASSALENARMSISAPHLDEWKSLVRSESKEKKRVDRYARQFRLQHYWRVVRQRYPKQTYRKKSQLTAIFADYFKVSEAMIRRDTQAMDILLDQPLSSFQ